MSAWKLIHLWINDVEYDLAEGPNTIGRGPHQITTSTISVSRNHCIIHVNNEIVTVEDLGSCNGTFVDNVKILPKVQIPVKDNQKIGIGSCNVSEMENNERFEFMLKRKVDTQLKLPLKRKLSPEIINVDSDSDNVVEEENVCNIAKKIKFEKEISENVMEVDSYEDDCYEIKQENYEEPISVDSDSESDMENDIWFLRLSQSSPGKPFIKVEQKTIYNDCPIKSEKEDSVEEEFMDDIIQLPEPVKHDIQFLQDDIDNPVIQVTKRKNTTPDSEPTSNVVPEIENCALKNSNEEDDSNNSVIENANVILDLKKQEQEIRPNASNKKALLIDFLSITTNDPKHNKHKSRHQKEKEVVKCTLSSSQKEERRRKLKEIATNSKDKINNQDIDTNITSSKDLNNANNKSIAVKITAKNRGAFLSSSVTNSSSLVIDNSKHNKTSKDVNKKSTERTDKSNNGIEGDIEYDEINEHLKSKQKVRKARQPVKNSEDNVDKTKNTRDKGKSKGKKKDDSNNSDHSKHSKKKSDRRSKSKRNSVTERNETTNQPSNSTLIPLVQSIKIKKRVTFSTAPPQVRVFEIEPGNQMKKTQSILDQQKPLLSASQNFLLNILRWNPKWLDEQREQNVPPPILAHNNAPTNMLQYFGSHRQYVQILTDLLLFEVWDTLHETYKHIKNQWLELTLTSAVDSGQRFEMFTLSVNITLPKSELKKVPRPSEVMFMEFGPREEKKRAFVWIQNVKPLHSNPNDMFKSYTLCLQVRSSKLTGLLPREKLYAIRLSCIQNECTMFDAIDYLTCSPLCEAILRPSANTLPIFENHFIIPKTLHTQSLNSSQLKAVSMSLSAALDPRPSIQMIQGPPGTGKSSVICSIVMSYFYDQNGMFFKDRGKVLICASSNAAIDELVIRLLNIRKTLSQDKRFRMVRVGRLEAMHRVAREISSVNLAQRNQTMKHEPIASTLTAEIAHLEAKINMWQSNLESAKDEGRVVYCQHQITEFKHKIARLRNPRGCNDRGQLTGELLFQAESSIVEGAHIIATTLSSTANRRLARIRGRIAFCIIDEAGQATEPQALVPLTLDVRRLVLIGDPQQLPAFTNSINARTYGLSESLFARLSNAVPHASTLLNVQYRMQPAIADYPNRVFYGGALRNAPAKRPSLPLPQYRLLAVNATSGHTESFPNVAESWCVSRLAAAVAECVRSRQLSLAVITPYNAQAQLIRTNINSILKSDEKVEVCSVDSFQGQERDVVIVSVARVHGSGFAAVPARLNVLLTRARHCLLLCLNTRALETSLQWKTLIDDAKRRNMFRALPDSLCLPGTSDDDILKHILE